MTLRQLKWLTILAPLLFLAGIEILRQVISPALFHAWPGYLLLAGIVLLGALFFAEAVFGVVGRLQDRLSHHNRELLALHDAGLEILGEIELQTVLQRVVDRARALVGARYGAISLLSLDGSIEQFLTTGLSPAERTLIGPPPVGHGLLGVVISEGVALRMADLTRDPRSIGFPANHPPMRSLLAVPIVSHGEVLGNLYLTEKAAYGEFSPDDEETLVRFATVAALAIENARLHRRVRAMAVTEEREWIAREMHDSLAQVLGYVNAKAQAAQVLLTDNQPDRAASQLRQLAEAARSAYADVREGILGLRTSLDGEKEFVETLQEYLRSWREQSGSDVSLAIFPAERHDSGLSPTAEVQLLRIVQEALANVRKHANAHAARVEIRHGANSVEIRVEDDGAGFVPDALGRADHPRFGLSTMKERAEAVGGSFALDAAPGHGTRVTVCLPYDSAQHSPREGLRRASSHR